MNKEIVIKLENISKYYKLYKANSYRLKEILHPGHKIYHKKFYALKNINLEIKRGETLGIIGMNGSGKSTLLKVISGILQPNTGTVNVNGKISALLELNAAFNPEFTGVENIYFYGTILGFAKEEIDIKLDDIISFADIGEYIYQPIKMYSSGMKSRLGFSVAVHVNPEILILDEILAVGDDLFKRKCFAKIEELFNKNKTILFVSHNISSVKTLCSRTIFLDKGSIQMDGDSKSVTTSYKRFIIGKNKNKIHCVKTASMDNYFEKKDSGENVYIDNNSVISGNMYLDGLLPESTKELRNHHVFIFEPRIERLNGDKVNVLITGEEYYFVYSIKFDVDVSEINLGFSIKNIKGIKITGKSSKITEEIIKHVCAGEQYEVKSSFECLLLPGLYFIDTKATGIINGKREILTKINDFYAFKIEDNEMNMYEGFVSLNQKINFVKN